MIKEQEGEHDEVVHGVGIEAMEVEVMLKKAVRKGSHINGVSSYNITNYKRNNAKLYSRYPVSALHFYCRVSALNLLYL
jgi:hypothetical protein